MKIVKLTSLADITNELIKSVDTTRKKKRLTILVFFKTKVYFLQKYKYNHVDSAHRVNRTRTKVPAIINTLVLARTTLDPVTSPRLLLNIPFRLPCACLREKRLPRHVCYVEIRCWYIFQRCLPQRFRLIGLNLSSIIRHRVNNKYNLCNNLFATVR